MGMGIQLEEMLELSATTQSIISQGSCYSGLAGGFNCETNPQTLPNRWKTAKLAKLNNL